jgi:hypothetical protein
MKQMSKCCFFEVQTEFSKILFGYASAGPRSIESDYGLDDRTIEVRSPAEAKKMFPLASVFRLALGPTQPPFPGAKARPGRDADHTPI